MISFFEKEEIRQILLENLCKRFPNGGCLAYGQQRLKILKTKLRNIHVLNIKAVKEKTCVKLVNKIKCEKCKGNGKSLQDHIRYRDGARFSNIKICVDCKGRGYKAAKATRITKEISKEATVIVKNGANISDKRIQNLQGIKICGGQGGLRRMEALKFFRDFYPKKTTRKIVRILSERQNISVKEVFICLEIIPVYELQFKLHSSLNFATILGLSAEFKCNRIIL